MTDELMKGLAVQALNMVKHDIEQGRFNFLLAVYNEGESLHRMKKIETLIIKALGEDWLNNGPAKDAGYGILREAVAMLPPEALVIATPIKSFTPTEQFQKLSATVQKKILGDGHDRQWQAVEAGYLEVCDALMVVIQTSARVCLCQQTPGGRKIDFFDQKGFGGRLKMFGAEKGEGSEEWVKKQRVK